jgi:hypothetical protein
VPRWRSMPQNQSQCGRSTRDSCSRADSRQRPFRGRRAPQRATHSAATANGSAVGRRFRDGVGETQWSHGLGWGQFWTGTGPPTGSQRLCLNHGNEWRNGLPITIRRAEETSIRAIQNHPESTFYGSASRLASNHHAAISSLDSTIATSWFNSAAP